MDFCGPEEDVLSCGLSTGFGVRRPGFKFKFSSLLTYEALGNLLNFSEPWFLNT